MSMMVPARLRPGGMPPAHGACGGRTDMAREITPDSFTVYQLDELQPAARKDAIWNVQHQLTGPWWGAADTESIEDEIVHGFAEALGTPGWDKHGPGDFPGIDGVELDGWDLDRGDALALRGELTRHNAPALPWTDEIEYVHLESVQGRYTRIEVVHQEPGEPLGFVQDAVIEAMNQGKRYGRADLEYRTSEERAEDDILANEREFYADGRLYRG